MAQTLLAIGLAGVAAVTAQQPVITAAGYTQIACPPPASGDCLQFSVFGNGFGAAPGQLQKGNFITPAPPPPPMPWDTPADLWPSNLATRTGGNGQCVARSLYTGDGFHYRFCPFQQVQHFSSGGFNIGTLGQYSGVIRDSNNANCPGGNAIVGQKFIDGSLCNGVPSTSFVNFVCVDVLGAGLTQKYAHDQCGHTVPRWVQRKSHAASPWGLRWCTVDAVREPRCLAQPLPCALPRVFLHPGNNNGVVRWSHHRLCPRHHPPPRGARPNEHWRGGAGG